MSVFQRLRSPNAPASPGERLRTAIAERLDSGYQHQCDTFNFIIAQINFNPELLPEEACAELGTEGAALLGLAHHIKEIAGIIAAYTDRNPAVDLLSPKEGYSYAPNQDGTIAVTVPPEPEPEEDGEGAAEEGGEG